MSVFYVGADGSLVSRRARVDAHGDRIEEALVVAGTSPKETGLSNAYPADAFVSASYDGFGTRGQFGVVVRDRSFVGSPQGMTATEARMAIRAAVCTAQDGTDSPVVFYLDREPVTRLFDQPLPEQGVRDADCPL